MAKTQKKILFIAPLPPPITGQSMASKEVLASLKHSYTVTAINFSKKTLKQGVHSFKRILEVINVLATVWIEKEKADVLYLTISQSIWGNLKDIITYLICFNKLPRMIIHLHGGGIKKIIFDRNRFMYHLNKFFIKRLGGVIVLGDSLTHIFESMISPGKIFKLNNFAENYLFLSNKEIDEKFKLMTPLKILFLSNLIPGKGHEELVEAYLHLNNDPQKVVEIDFAGGFQSDSDEMTFLNKINNIKALHYHGVVDGITKKKLFSGAHIFCLPTYYDYEGQPISILEAYASGCVVLTSDHGGIKDIFKNGYNGFMIQKKSSHSIKEKIEAILLDVEKLKPIAFENRKIANEKFRSHIFRSSLIEIIERFEDINGNYDAR